MNVLKPKQGARRTARQRPSSCIRVVAPGRLHFGLLNTSASFGRVDGGIGLAIAEPHWDIEVSATGEGLQNLDLLTSEQRSAIEACTRLLAFALPPETLTIKINSSIPPHAGFGSKTSLLLSIGRAISQLVNVPLRAADLASLLGRGGTSGIGVHSFQHGGLLWDGGHKYPEKKSAIGPSSDILADPPPLIGRFHFDWLEVVHFRFADSGPSGVKEHRLFANHCPTKQTDTVKSTLEIVWRLIPAAIEEDDQTFQNSLRQLQSCGFKQTEWSVQNKLTTGFRNYWNQLDLFECLCLSSFGPTMFVLTRRPDDILKIVHDFPLGRPIHARKTKAFNDAAFLTEF